MLIPYIGLFLEKFKKLPSTNFVKVPLPSLLNLYIKQLAVLGAKLLITPVDVSI